MMLTSCYGATPPVADYASRCDVWACGLRLRFGNAHAKCSSILLRHSSHVWRTNTVLKIKIAHAAMRAGIVSGARLTLTLQRR